MLRSEGLFKGPSVLKAREAGVLKCYPPRTFLISHLAGS